MPPAIYITQLYRQCLPLEGLFCKARLYSSWDEQEIYTMLIHTVCPGRSDPFYIVTFYIKWVTTSWTDGIWLFFLLSNQQTKFTTKKCRFVLPNTNSVYCFKMSYKSVLHKNRFANVHLKHSCQSKSSFLHIWNQFSIQKLYILVYTSSYFYQIRNKLWSSKFCKCWYLFLFAVSFFIQSDKSA